MNEVNGNIIDIAEEGGYDIVLHNCNCQNTMGSGVAKEIAKHWPEVYKADCNTVKGDFSKLGTYSKATVTRRGNTFTVYNLYGQFRYGERKLQLFDIDAFENALCLLAIELHALKRPMKILFPLLGTGSAGGRWSAIAPRLESILKDHHLTLVRL